MTRVAVGRRRAVVLNPSMYSPWVPCLRRKVGARRGCRAMLGPSIERDCRADRWRYDVGRRAARRSRACSLVCRMTCALRTPPALEFGCAGRAELRRFAWIPRSRARREGAGAGRRFLRRVPWRAPRGYGTIRDGKDHTASFYVNAAGWVCLAAILERRDAGARRRGELTSVTMPEGLGGAETIVLFTAFFIWPQRIVPLFAGMSLLVVITVAQRMVWGGGGSDFCLSYRLPSTAGERWLGQTGSRGRGAFGGWW